MSQADQVRQLGQQIHEAADAFSHGDHEAAQRLMAVTTKLQRTIEPPRQCAMRFRMQPVQNVAVVMAVEMGLLDILVARPGESVPSKELAHQSAFDETLIVRVMRMLTAVGVVIEVDENLYQSNDVTKSMVSKGSKGGLQLTNRLLFHVACKIREYLRQPELRSSDSDYLQEKTPFSFAYGTSIWGLFEKDSELKQAFDDNMAGRNAMQTLRWHQKYPAASQLPSIAQHQKELCLVDVAGNRGHDIISFREAHPEISGRFVLQDLPETISTIKEPPRGIELVEYDFFTPQPVRGASAYYFHSILHDWGNKACRSILGNTAAAMDKHSRILIDDIVLADKGESVPRAEIDIVMMMLQAGMERTLHQWEELFASVEPPLELVRVWTRKEDWQSVIEVKLRGAA